MTNSLRPAVLTAPHNPDFTDPIGLLVKCHERIWGFLTSMEAAAEILLHGGPDDEAFAAIDAGSAHFATPGRKHTEDEEVSLFPRLRASNEAAAAEALAAMAELESQHRTAERLHQDFDAAYSLLNRSGDMNERQLEKLCNLAAEMTSLYRPHIQLENEFVFPIASRVVPPEDLQRFGEEMRERRRLILQRLGIARP